MVLLGKRPPKVRLSFHPGYRRTNDRPLQGRRLLVISTTSNRAMLNDMDVMDAFASDIRVPPLSSLSQIDYVLRDVALFRTAQEGQRAMGLLQQAGFGEEGKVVIGIKKLLSMVEFCRADPEPGEKLVSSMIELSL